MDRIQLRRDTSARWKELNPVLLEGEVGFETDTKLRKIGDGTNAWNSLDYLAAENIVQEYGISENAVPSINFTSRMAANQEVRIITNVPILSAFSIELGETLDTYDKLTILANKQTYVSSSNANALTNNAVIYRLDSTADRVFTIGASQGVYIDRNILDSLPLNGVIPDNAFIIRTIIANNQVSDPRYLPLYINNVWTKGGIIGDILGSYNNYLSTNSGAMTRKTEVLYPELKLKGFNSFGKDNIIPPSSIWGAIPSGEVYYDLSNIKFEDGYIDNTGAIKYLLPYKHSDYITKKSDTVIIVVSSNYTVAAYDSSKNFISIIGTQDMIEISKLTLPSNTTYFRVNIPNEYYFGTGFSVNKLVMNGDLSYNIPWLTTTGGGVNSLNGHNWVSLGDSITYQNMWQPYLTQLFKCNSFNCGQNATCMGIYSADPLKNSAMSQDSRIQQVINYNPDIVTILAGANDLMYASTVGTIQDITTKNRASFMGAYAYVIDKLLIWKPSLRIIILTPTWAHNDGLDITRPSNLTYTDFANAAKEVASYFGLRYVDLHSECGFNTYTQDLYFPDHIHPNSEGGKRISECVFNTFNSIYRF